MLFAFNTWGWLAEMLATVPAEGVGKGGGGGGVVVVVVVLIIFGGF